jgi:hypothetical protein
VRPVAAAGTSTAAAPVDGRPAAPWLESLGLGLLLFAGKGGVGKSTCAAAAAAALAGTRDVLLCSTDPAGSLDDVLGPGTVAAGRAGPRLRVVQIDAAAEAERRRAAWRDDAAALLERFGLSESADPRPPRHRAALGPGAARHRRVRRAGGAPRGGRVHVRSSSSTRRPRAISCGC